MDNETWREISLSLSLSIDWTSGKETFVIDNVTTNKNSFYPR